MIDLLRGLSDTTLLFAGISAVLVVATLIAETLRWRTPGPSAVIDNLVARIRAWWVMAAVVGLGFLGGRVGMTLLFALISLFALREFITLTPTRRGDYWALVAAFYVVLPYQYWLVYSDWYGMYTLLIPVYAFLFLPILSTVGGDTTGYLERTSKVQWGLMVSVFCISHVPALLNLQIDGYAGRNLLLIAFLYLYRARGSEWALVLTLNLMTGTLAWPLWNSLEDYQQARIISFVDPTVDPQGSGYQVIMSTTAIGSGGIFGHGYLEGPQKRLRFLPEQHTDFIYAVIGEETGLIGGGLVLLAYFIILWRLIRLAERLPDPFSGIVVFGVAGAWLTHVLVNIGMALGVMPVTGIPLPFVSYGGSFLLATYIALGVAQRVALEQGRI